MPEDIRREYPNQPVVAVSGIIQDGRGRILIVRRAKEPGRGKWSLPGGAVRLGETLKDALHREIREECGIRVEVKYLYGAFDRIFRDGDGRVRYHYVILNYLCQTEGETPHPGSDTDAYRWIASRAELGDFAFTEGVRELLDSVFRKSDLT